MRCLLHSTAASHWAMDVIRPDTAMKVAKAEEGRSVVLMVHDHSKEIKLCPMCGTFTHPLKEVEELNEDKDKHRPRKS